MRKARQEKRCVVGSCITVKKHHHIVVVKSTVTATTLVATAAEWNALVEKLRGR